MTLADLYFVEPGTELERRVEETRNTGQGVEAARLASKRFAKLLANVTIKPGVFRVPGYAESLSGKTKHTSSCLIHA